MDIEKRLTALEEKVAKIEASQTRPQELSSCMEKIQAFSEYIVPMLDDDFTKITPSKKSKLLKPNS